MAGGRPTKCTPALIEEFAGYMAAGLYFEDACDLCHIGRRTPYQWLEWGEAALEEADWDFEEVPEEKQLYAQFTHTVRARAAAALGRNVALVQQAGQDRDKREGIEPGDWRAAAWFLEHRRPDTWGKRERDVNLGGQPGNPVLVVPVFGEEDPIGADLVADDGDDGDGD